jgi:hypothetical protein
VLKKAGIVVAAAAAGLLAVSPLAFAGETHHGHHDSAKKINSVEQDHSQTGLINTSTSADTNSSTAAQNCGNGATNTPSVALPEPPAPLAPVVAPVDAVLGVLAPAPTSGTADVNSQVTCEQASSAGNTITQNND